MKHQGFRQPLVLLLITVHLVMIFGCTATNRLTLPANEIPVGANFKIAAVILKDGQIITFDRDGGLYIEKMIEGKWYRAIIGMTVNKSVEVDPEKVLEVKFEQTESSGADSFIVGFLIGLPVGALGLFLALLAAYGGH